MLGTQLDLAYSMLVLSQFNANLTTAHQDTVKWTLHYIQGTTNYRIYYGSQKQVQRQEQYSTLLGFADSDWAGNKDYQKYTTSYVFILNGRAVLWKSSWQQSVALSSIEAEYMAYTEAAKEAI